MFLCHFFFFNGPAPPEIYTLSLHDALPISCVLVANGIHAALDPVAPLAPGTQYELRLRSEEHTSELQSRRDLVCRLLLEKKKSQVAASRRPLAADTHRHL